MTDILTGHSPDMSENSQHPNQSMSTDSEESFLMKQINKSQLFNNTSSSGGTASNSTNNISNSNRRSFFRESYIDEDGAIKSFSVYQDAINETSDESRDISLTGLSAINLENMITAREPQNTQLNNILSEIDGNHGHQNLGGSRFGHRKSASVSRSDSLKELKQTHKRMSGSSFRISDYGNLQPQVNHSAYSGSTSGSELHQTSNPRSSSVYGNLNLPPPLPPTTVTPRLSELSIEHEYPLHPNLQRIPTPLYAAPPPPTVSGETHESAREVTLDALTGLTQMARKQKSSSTIGSYKSAHSLTRASILNFEETRRRQKGVPNLVPQSAHTTVRFHDSRDFITNDVIKDGVSEVGVTPSIHSPSSDGFPEAADDASIRNTRRAKMYSGQSLVKKEMGLKEFKLRPPSIHQDTPLVIPYYKRDDGGEYPTDTLLEKLHHDRENRPERYYPDTNRLAWWIYFISFIVPPLFFFLGFGLLDKHLGAVDVGVKRISLLTGTIVLMITLAMIGVGFGVGITRAAE